MKKKIKCKHIFCEMFQTNYYVYYGISPSEYKNEVKKVSGCDIDLSYGANDTIDGEACVYNVEGVEVIFIWTKHKYISVLVHECMHAVHMILRDKNITLSDETDELYAYYMQNLVRRILEGDKK